MIIFTHKKSNSGIFLNGIYFNNRDQLNEFSFPSREGALNLLRDFEGVSEWIIACKDVQPEHVEILAKHEVLRTCEGVGKILLRKPFEVIPMTEQIAFTPRQPQKASGNFFKGPLKFNISNVRFDFLQSQREKLYCHQRCLYQIKSVGWSCELGIEIDSTQSCVSVPGDRA